MRVKNVLIPLIVFAYLAVSAGLSNAFDRVYTMGDKIDSSPLIIYAKVLRARELFPLKKKKTASENEIAGDYLYRLEVIEVVKGRGPIKEIIIVQSPEYRAEPRYFTEGQKVLAFLKINSLSGSFRLRYGLSAKTRYYETFANQQGVIALADSTSDLCLGSVKKYVKAKTSKKAQGPALWAALLENSPDELKENALIELSSGIHYPALDLFIKYLGDEYFTSLAYKNLLLFPTDTLEARLDMIMQHKKTGSRLVRVNLIKTVAPIHDDNVFKFLQKALKDDKFEVRATAAKALEKWTDKKAVKSLAKALNDEDDYVREAAYQALTTQGYVIEKNTDSTYKIIH